MAGASTLIGGVVAVGVGEAASTALDPVLEPQRQAAWDKSQARIFDLGELAGLVASGLVSIDAAIPEANRNGYTGERLRAAVQLQLVAAPVAELLELWRRGKIGVELVEHGLAKAKIEPQYWEPLKELFVSRLDPAIIATAIQRGIMRDPGFLPVGPPTAEGKVPAFPVSPLDPVLEAQANGIDEPRLFVETAIVGLPLSLQEAASAYFRGIIELADFQRAVSEGNTRNEWGDAALAQARQILTAAEYCELELRGFLTTAERHALTNQHGMSAADSDRLFDVLGRAPAVHGVTTGLARGGTFNGPIGDIPPVYLSAMQRSNARPEWYSIDYANRYSYPSAFVLRALLQGGVITAAQGEQYFLDIGWPPQLAKQVAEHYGATTTAASDPHVTKAQTQLWTTLHGSYKAEEIDAATAQTTLTTLGVATSAQPEVLSLWDAERALIRKQLSPSQIHKAVSGGVVNPATGVAWSLQDGIDALLARGYDLADAQTLLTE
jgi:hypothetical protein